MQKWTNALILIIFLVNITYSLEFPEKPHKQYAFFLYVEIDNQGTSGEIQFFSNGECYLPGKDCEKEKYVGLTSDEIQAIYSLARQIIHTAKFNDKIEGPDGRHFSVHIETVGTSILLNLKEKSIDKDIYDQLVVKVSAIYKKYNDNNKK